MKDRVEYIDIAKGLGMLAIIWGHLTNSGWHYALVYSFHIPLFFFLSGLVYNNKKHTDFTTFIKGRAKRLFIPYVVYSIVTWVLWVFYLYITHQVAEKDIYSPLLQTFIAQGSGGFLVHNVALWFIPCLFCVQVMFYFIGKLKKVWAFVVCCLIAGLSMYCESIWGNAYSQTLPWNLDSGFMALPFYCVGNMVGINKPLYDWAKQSKLATLAVALVLTAVLQWAACKWGPISMGHSNFGNEWVFHIRGLIGSFSTLFFSMFLASILTMSVWIDKVINYVKWVGKNSLDFMAINNPIKGIVCTVLAAILNIETDDASFADIPPALLAFLITMVGSTILVWMILYVRNKGWFSLSNIKKSVKQ